MNENRKPNETDRDPLADALFDAAEPYAEDAYEMMEGKGKKKKASFLRFLPAAAAVLVLCAGGLLVPALLRGGKTLPPDQPLPGTEQTDPGAILPPWRKADFSFRTVTYRGENENRPVSFLLPRLTEQAAETEGKTEAEKITTLPGENIALSLSPSCRISGFSGSLVRLAKGVGEHETCDSVWYDLEKDEVFCLSCFLREKMHKEPYYLDACVRCLIENGLISSANLFAGDIEAPYRDFYELMNNETTLGFFRTEDAPTVESLGLSGTALDSERGRAAVAAFRYPAVQVIEYGSDPDHCLFTLVCPDGNGRFGSFVYDFRQETFTKLDGETIGQGKCFDAFYSSYQEDIAPDLTASSGVLIENGYRRILVTAPAYVEGMIDMIGEVLLPVYDGLRLYEFRIEENGVVMSTPDAAFGSKDPAQTLPIAPAKMMGSIVWYPTRNDRTAIFDKNGALCLLDGTPLGIFEDDDGAQYALLSLYGQEKWYRLPFGKQLADDEVRDLVSALGGGAFLLSDDGTVRTDLGTGEKVSLFEGRTVLAHTLTEDGRFLFALTCEGVEGIDLYTMERAVLSLPAEYEETVKDLTGIAFDLMLNAKEDTLLLTYHSVGTLAFDREAFFAAEADEMRLKGLIPGRDSMLQNFDADVKYLTSYYTLNGEPLRILDTGRFCKLARVVSMPLLDRYFEEKSAHTREELRSLLADIGDRMLPYLMLSGEYAEQSAKVDAALVTRALGGLGDESFGSGWFNHFRPYAQSNTLQPEDTPEFLAEEMATGFLRLTTGYYVFPSLEYRVAEEQRQINLARGDTQSAAWWEGYQKLLRDFEDKINASLDKEKMESIRKTLTDRIKQEIRKLTLTELDGITYTVYTQRELIAIYDRLFPELLSIAGIEDIDGMVLDGSMFSLPYSSDLFYGRADVIEGCPEFDEKHAIDYAALRSFLGKLEFEEGKVSLSSTEACIHCEQLAFGDFFPILSAGIGEDGKAYLTFFDSHALLTEEQLASFRALCSEKLYIDDEFTDGFHTTYLRLYEAFSLSFSRSFS